MIMETIKTLEKEYDAYEFNDIRVGIVVKKDSKVGLIDREFNIIIPLMYESLYLVEFDKNRMIAQLDETWLIIDNQNNTLFKSTHNYDSNPEWDMNYFDSSYCYVPYLDGYIEHYTDKIILVTRGKREEFSLKSDSAMCFDDSPLVYFFDGEVRGYLNLETGFIQLDILMDVRKKEFNSLIAYDVDEILCAGEKPYSLFEQDSIIQELKDNGITTIINLMQENERKYNTTELEKEFTVKNFPIIDNSVPSIDVLYEVIHTIDKSEKTYVHCNLGLGRTGIVVGYYLYKKYGYRGSSIIQKIKELKYECKLAYEKSPITKEQIEFLERLI